MNNVGYIAKPEPPIWRIRWLNKLFPHTYCEFPEAPDEYKDVITCVVTSKLCWLDRLRVLISGKIQIESKIVTEHEIGKHKTNSVFRVLPSY